MWWLIRTGSWLDRLLLRRRGCSMAALFLLVVYALIASKLSASIYCNVGHTFQPAPADGCPRLVGVPDDDDVAALGSVAGEVTVCRERLVAHVAARKSPLVSPPPPQKPRGITVVTAFFVIKSKHSSDEYIEWFCNFRRSTRLNVYVFTDAAGARAMQRCEVHGCVYFDVRRDVWDVGNMTHYRESYEDQLQLDPERGVVDHSPELYAIWNAKIQMLRDVAAWNPFDSETFLWVDMGSFRVPNTWFGPRWPDPAAYRALGVHRGEMLVSIVSYPMWTRWSLPDPLPLSGRCESSEYVQGGFFGGSGEALEWWSREFFAVHDHALRTGRFVGKDQRIMNAVATLNKHRVRVLESAGARRCGWDVWFVFQHALATKEYRCDACYIPPPMLMSDFLPAEDLGELLNSN